MNTVVPFLRQGDSFHCKDKAHWHAQFSESKAKGQIPAATKNHLIVLHLSKKKKKSVPLEPFLLWKKKKVYLCIFYVNTKQKQDAVKEKTKPY